MNPWNLHDALLAKHAQHVVLIHFPIALCIIGVLVDAAAAITRRRDLAAVAFWNLTLAAMSAIPAAITGVLAWQWEFAGRHLKGILLLHLLAGSTSLLLILAVWLIHERARRNQKDPSPMRWPIEALAVLAVAVTGHLGGFLSGVNHP